MSEVQLIFGPLGTEADLEIRARVVERGRSVHIMQKHLDVREAV